MTRTIVNSSRRIIAVLLAVLVLFSGMGAARIFAQSSTVDPVTIPLTGSATSRDAEFSGMAWYGDWLVLLPQFPWFDGFNRTGFFVLPRQEIVDFLDGRLSGPLTPRLVPMDVSGILNTVPGFEGFESIVFVGDTIYVTAEADLGSEMAGWILRGTIQPDLSSARIDVTTATSIPVQAAFPNMSDEAILVRPGAAGIELLTFYEANGRLANRNAVVHRFGADLTPLPSMPMANIEYRVTDATELDAEGRFWVTNYFWPGEAQLLLGGSGFGGRLRAILARTRLHPIERIVELQVTDNGIDYTDTPPVNLTLGEGDSRNWEGIVRLEDRGFLLVTDKFPETILAFVPNN
jgi:hypothetical protein